MVPVPIRFPVPRTNVACAIVLAIITAAMVFFPTCAMACRTTGSYGETRLEAKMVEARFLLGLPPDETTTQVIWATRIESASHALGFNGLPVADRAVRIEVHGRDAIIRLIGVTRSGVANASTAANLTDSARIVAIVPATRDERDRRTWIDLTSLLVGLGPEPDGEKWWHSFLGAQNSPVENRSLSRMLDAKIVGSSALFRAEVALTYQVGLTSAIESQSAGSQLGASVEGSIAVLHAFLPLPLQPMEPRLHDPRVGFLSVPKQFFYSRPPGFLNESYILKYRLDAPSDHERSRKASPGDYLQDGKIVFYIGPEVPQDLHSAIRAGVLDWNSAFEAAGFRNVLEVKDTPCEEGWNPSDPQYNTIRWVAQPVSNAIGRPLVDPRSGEILSASVYIWAGAVTRFSDQYRVSVGLADPRNVGSDRTSIESEVLRYLVAHEVGHALGLAHNFKAGTAFSTSWLKSRSHTAEFGTSPSIMSYGRFNYIADRGDELVTFVPKVSIYDKAAIAWGYGFASRNMGLTPVKAPGLSVEQSSRLLQYSGDNDTLPLDAETPWEVIGSDRTFGTREGLRKLEWTWDRVATAPVGSPQELATLRREFEAALYFRTSILRGAIRQIAGVVETRDFFGSGHQWTSVALHEQKSALEIVSRALGDTTTHSKMLTAASRIYPLAPHIPILRSYDPVLSDLVSAHRLARLHSNGRSDLSVAELFRALSSGLVLHDSSDFALTARNLVARDLRNAYLARLKRLSKEPVTVPVVAASHLTGGLSAYEVDVRRAATAELIRLRVMAIAAARIHTDTAVRDWLGEVVELAESTK